MLGKGQRLVGGPQPATENPFDPRTQASEAPCCVTIDDSAEGRPSWHGKRSTLRASISLELAAALVQCPYSVVKEAVDAGELDGHWLQGPNPRVYEDSFDTWRAGTGPSRVLDRRRGRQQHHVSMPTQDPAMVAPFTAREAAVALGVSSKTLVRWARDNAIPSFRTPGGHLRFDRKEIEAWKRREPVSRDGQTVSGTFSGREILAADRRGREIALSLKGR